MDDLEINSAFVKEYLENVLEAFVILLIIRAIIDKPIDYLQIFKASIIIGLLVSIATTINEDFKANVRQGLHYGVSGLIVSQFSPVV
jgi:magnesium-transporting ATPase (P-type)